MGSLAIDQAFIDKFVKANFGLSVAHENLPFQPTPGTAYAEIRLLQNDMTPFGLSSSNISDGIFRVILRYPLNAGAIAAKTMADTIFAAYPLGARISYSDTSATIASHKRAEGYPEDGWYKLVLSFGYRAFITR